MLIAGLEFSLQAALHPGRLKPVLRTYRGNWGGGRNFRDATMPAPSLIRTH